MKVLGLEQVRTLITDFMVKQARTEEELRAEIEQYVPLLKDEVTQADLENLFDEMRTRHDVLIESGATLVAPGFVEWFDATRRRETEWFYWDRYRSLLTRGGFPGPVLEAMNQKTNRVIELCGDPLSDQPFDRRGMVMGLSLIHI